LPHFPKAVLSISSLQFLMGSPAGMVLCRLPMFAIFMPAKMLCQTWIITILFLIFKLQPNKAAKSRKDGFNREDRALPCWVEVWGIYWIVIFRCFGCLDQSKSLAFVLF
jgi:hypothetical protein